MPRPAAEADAKECPDVQSCIFSQVLEDRWRDGCGDRGRERADREIGPGRGGDMRWVVSHFAFILHALFTYQHWGSAESSIRPPPFKTYGKTSFWAGDV